MTLSLCSQCKNYSEEVCLLGQSYVDVFSSVQNLVDEQERQRISHALAICAYWEESDLSKLFSREVTLSYHAWNRLAYMKIQNGDRDLFQSLITAAREIILQQRQAVDPAATLNTGDGLQDTANPIQPGEGEPEQPEAMTDEPMPDIAMAEEDAQPVLPTQHFLDEAAAMMPPLNAATTLTPPTEDSPSLTVAQSATQSEPSASVVPMPAPMKLPSAPPTFHPEIVGQPGIPMALDPIEMAMQELWVMATAASHGAHNGQHVGDMLDAGRGTGRLDPTAE